MSQVQLEFAARARHGDPQESRDAAATIAGEKMTRAMSAVLACLDETKLPLSDEALVIQYRLLGDFVRQTEQSIRSRRAQLTRLGYVAQAGKMVNAAGNGCRTWVITDAGRRYLAEHPYR